MRPCPSCRQPIAGNAWACPHCGHRPNTLLAKLFLWIIVAPTVLALLWAWIAA